MQRGDHLQGLKRDWRRRCSPTRCKESFPWKVQRVTPLQAARSGSSPRWKALPLYNGLSAPSLLIATSHSPVSCKEWLPCKVRRVTPLQVVTSYSPTCKESLSCKVLRFAPLQNAKSRSPVWCKESFHCKVHRFDPMIGKKSYSCACCNKSLPCHMQRMVPLQSAKISRLQGAQSYFPEMCQVFLP